MRYLPLSEIERQKILKVCQVPNFDKLTEQVPADLKLNKLLDIEPSLDEESLVRFFESLSQKNLASQMTSFLGQGAYDHSWPRVIDQITNRGEFLTAYTPYQPEISQGTLQVIFEYQSMVSELTGFEVSNASLYDGATSVVEGVLMAARLQGQAQGKVILTEGLYDRYQNVLKSYLEPLGFEFVIWHADQNSQTSISQSFQTAKLSTEKPLTAVVMQSPNTWGQIEDFTELKILADQLKTKSIAVVTHGHSLAKYQSPGSRGIDICTGELQTFGIPVGFGGPYLGLISCQKKDVRQMPGRLVGLTSDSRGQTAFCITLATREQHIRREKATSNICSNQNLMATRACVYMSLMGPTGLVKVADVSKAHALYVKRKIENLLADRKSKITTTQGETFLNEWSLFVPQSEAAFVSRFENQCKTRKILGGVKVRPPKYFTQGLTAIAFAFTEKHLKPELDNLLNCIEEAL
jgi:glycine dehydrogenase subunit 1